MALLEYDIRVIGRRALEAEFASIERRLAQHNASVARMTGTSTAGAPRRSGSTGATVAADARAAGMAQRQQAREAEAAARAGARAKILADRQAAKEAASLAREARRHDEYWARTKVGLVRERHREEQRSHRQSLAEQRREERRVELDRRRADRVAAREARREAGERSSFVRSTLGGTAGRVGRTFSAVGTMGLATVGIGGAALAAGALSQVGKLDEGSRRLAIMGRDVGQTGMNADQLRQQFTRVGIATGTRPEDVMAGVTAYTTETGDLKSAMANAQVLATVAQAASASMEDVSRAAAHMQKVGVTSVDDMKQALSTLTMQGKKSGYELKDMASEFALVMSQAAKMGIRGVEGTKKLGGFLQVTQKATGNASETTTAMGQFFNQLVAKSDDFASGKAFGGNKVNVFADKGKTQFRDFRDLIGEVLVASEGNIESLNSAFEIRGSRAFDLFTTSFNDTRGAALKRGASKNQATEEGRQAAIGLLDRFSNAPGDFKEIERDAADAMSSFSVQMGIVQDRLKGAVSAELFGALRELGPDMGRLVMPVRTLTRVLVEAARLLGNNPFAGIGAVIAFQIAMDVSKARIGDALKSAVDRASGVLPHGAIATPGHAGTTGSGLPGASSTVRRGAPSIMDGLGAAATGAAVGITIGTAILTAGVVNFQAEEAAMNVGGDRVREALASNDPERLRQLLNEQQSESAKAKRGAEGRKKIEEATTGALATIAAPGLALFDTLFGTDIRKDLGSGLATVGGMSSQTAANTQANFEDQIQKRVTGIESLQEFAVRLEKAGVQQEAAAKQLSAAAERLGLASKDIPNRTAAASTTKT